MSKRNQFRGPPKSHPRAASGPPVSVWRAPKGGRVVIGHHALRELLEINSGEILKLGFEDQYERNQDLVALADLAKKKKIKIEPISSRELEAVGSHQGAIAVVKSTPAVNWKSIFNKTKSQILVLDGVEDPHNLGAILRTAWLMNTDAVILSEDRSVSLTGTVHKVACGGVEHVATEPHHQFINLFEQLREKGYWIFGLDAEAEKSLLELEIPDKVCWVLGSEGKGLRKPTLRACDESIKLPQASAAASYNVSNAAAMTLFETHRQFCNRAT